MITEAAAEIVSQKLDILISHLVGLECLSMQGRAEGAQAKLAMIQEFFSTQCRPHRTTEWSGRLLQTMYYAEEFIDKFHLREARERHGALHMASRPLAGLISKYKLWRDLSILGTKMEELCGEKFLKEAAERKRKNEPAASSSSHNRASWQGTKLARLTSFWDRYEPIMGLYHKDQKNKLMKRIRKEPTQVQGTSILGISGSGKTVLAGWVHIQAKYMGYKQRAWVHLSASMDQREFLFEILKQVENFAREMKDMRIEEIKKMLRRRLADKKRFFIVLDDVQPSNEPLLRELAMTIPFSSQGRIIYTTQDEKIAQYMSSDKPIKLPKLNDVQSQALLAWKLHGVSDGLRLSDEEKEIVGLCSGLPLSISLLGGFLSNTEEHKRAALVKEVSMMIKEGSTMAPLGILELSCHKLPDHLKPCFIYMALFPVALPIPTRRLVRLWLAEGLLDPHRYDIGKETTRQPEDVGEIFIQELADRNVIDVLSWRADGSPKACHMVIALHEMIWPIAMSMGFLHIHASRKSNDGNDRDPTKQQQQPPAQPRERTKIRWLAEHTNIVTDVRGSSYPNLNLRHVRSFLSFYLRRGVLTKDISTVLRKMTSETDYSLLRVLDLEGVYKPYLQGVLHKLVLLRYLGLRSTVLDSLPSAVGDLHHLETLDIKHTNITALPNSLWKAKNLRHLHLNWFYIDLKTILKACSNNVNALTQLQTLSGLVIGEVTKNTMTGHMNSLTTLTKLKLFLQHSNNDTSGAAGKTVADWISFELTNLQSLTFGVIQEAKPTEEAAAAKGAEPEKEASTAKGAEPAKGATKVTQHARKAKPLTSQVGPLPQLSLGEKHHQLLELYLLGQLNRPNWRQLLPGSLRVLTLSGSKVEVDMMPELGGLLRSLRTLRLLANSFRGKTLRFAKDGFPSLVSLKIWKLPLLEEVTIETGAMLQLKELEFRHLDAMNNVRGISVCQELKTIRVVFRKEARGFVHLLEKIKSKETQLDKIEETETPESTDDEDEDNGDEKGKTHSESQTEEIESTDEDDTDEKEEMPSPQNDTQGLKSTNYDIGKKNIWRKIGVMGDSHDEMETKRPEI